MADLSKMLGDVYGEPTPPREPAQAPEWADEERLDEAFEGWTPGPSADASEAERRFFGSRSNDEPAPLADDLASALSEAVLANADQQTDAVDLDEVDETPAPTPYTPRRSAFDFGSLDNDEDIYKAMAVLRHDPEVTAEPAPPAPEPAQAPAPAPAIEPEPAAPVAVAGPWQRENDDILPRRGRSRGVQLSFRRR